MTKYNLELPVGFHQGDFTICNNIIDSHLQEDFLLDLTEGNRCFLQEECHWKLLPLDFFKFRDFLFAGVMLLEFTFHGLLWYGNFFNEFSPF